MMDQLRGQLAASLAVEGRDQGFIIVAVLWILAALAAFVSIYSVYVVNTAVASRVVDTRLEAQALLTAAVELAVFRSSLGEEKDRSTSGDFGFHMGRAEVSARFVSEGARIDLNAAKKELLAGLFASLGARDDAPAYADRIIGWRRKTKAGGRNEEVEFYQHAGSPYGPRQAPFESTAELRLVRGLPSPIVERMLPFVTVFNGQPGIDAMIAPPEVLAALPDMSSGRVSDILETRRRGDPKAVLDLLGTARNSVSLEPRKAMRVLVRVAFDTGRRVNADIVVLSLEDGPEPYRILAWQDDFEGMNSAGG